MVAGSRVLHFGDSEAMRAEWSGPLVGPAAAPGKEVEPAASVFYNSSH